MENQKKLKYLDQIEMGKRIRAKREYLGMTREELSAELGVSSKFLADIEYGDKGISIKKLYLLSQILEISTDYMLAGKKEGDIEDTEKEQIKEHIWEPLKNCNNEQLRCMEQITLSFVEGIKNK